MAIKFVRDRISREDLQKLARETYVDMIKGVVDVRREVIAFGGELHADAEAELLADGSAQKDLWGFNLVFGKPLAEALEFTSLINIRPSVGNSAMEIRLSDVREKVRRIVSEKVVWGP